MKKVFSFLLMASIFCLNPISSLYAAEPVKGSIGVDLVSTYAWRGQKLDGAAIQPTLGIEWEGLSLSAWGSTGFSGDYRELDFSLGYSVGGFSIGLTDYWCADSSTKYFTYHRDTPHMLEANIGYDFGPVAFSWNTYFLGFVGLTSEGKKAYATYFEVSAPFSFAGLEWSAAVAASPWENDFYGVKGFGVVNCSLTASKDLEIGSATIPVFAQIMANPRSQKCYLTFGLSF
ncbi:MAG: hypothetical protein MJZ16_04130 [Bacteroidales bacterium]|nr:hypothetical protein [Bacteroidales bacterium]